MPQDSSSHHQKKNTLLRLLALALMVTLGIACSSEPDNPGNPGGGSSGGVGGGGGGVPPAVDGTVADGLIGPEGGTVRHPSGAELIVPAGALAVRTRLTLTGLAAPSSEVLAGATVLGQSIEAGPEGQTFFKPVDVVIPFDPTRLPKDVDPSTAQVRVAPHGSSDFIALDSHVDVAARVIRTQTVHFSEFVPAVNPNPVFITAPASLPDATVGVAYAAQQFVATGGTQPYTWSLAAGSSLPPGLGLSGSGSLGGTATAVGTSSFFAKVSDSAGHAVQKAFALTVSAANNPIPVLTAMSPSSATSGSTATTLSLTGLNFAPASEARWDGNPLPTTFVSTTELATTITADLLVTAGTHSVSVFTAAPGGGTSASISFVIADLPNQNPVPTITEVDPSSLPLSAVDTQITITGTSFSVFTSASIDAQGISTLFISATQLYATIPASYLASAAVLNINVYNPPPGGGFGPATVPLVIGTAPVSNPAPTLSSITHTSTPVNSATFTLSLTGSSFVATGQAFFGATALSTTVLSGTSATAVVPSSLVTTTGTRSVTFVNPAPGGGTSGGATFKVTAAALACSSAQVSGMNPTNSVCDPYANTLCSVKEPFCENIGATQVQRTFSCQCPVGGSLQWSCQTTHAPCVP